jgi:hypothetical protein
VRCGLLDYLVAIDAEHIIEPSLVDEHRAR